MEFIIVPGIVLAFGLVFLIVNAFKQSGLKLSKTEKAGIVGFSIGRFFRIVAIIVFFPVALVVIACLRLATPKPPKN